MARRLVYCGLNLCLLSSSGLPLQAQLVQNTSGDPVALDFAHRVETTLAAGDPAFVRQSLDLSAVLDTAMSGLDAPDASRSAFRRGVASTLDFTSPLVDAIKKGGTYRFLRLRSGVGGRTQALFRLLGHDRSVNYHEYALQRGAAGAVKIVDLYIFTSGEWWSQTFRRAWLGIASANGLAGGLSHLMQGDSEFVKNLPQIQAMQKLNKEGKFAQALDAWLRLPVVLHADKNLLVQRVNIASHVGDKEYGEAVDAFFKYHPTDAALDLLLIDACFNKQQWDQGLAALQRLDRALGGDAHIDFLRGNLLYKKGDLPAAKVALKQAIASEPTLLGPYWTLVTIAVEGKDHPETARLLTVLEKERGVKLGDLKGVDFYADFTKSDAYGKWMKSR